MRLGRKELNDARHVAHDFPFHPGARGQFLQLTLKMSTVRPDSVF